MKSSEKRFAILVHIGNVEGGGGIERFYLNLIKLLNDDFVSKIDIITTKEGKCRALQYMPGIAPNRIKAFPLLSNRFSLGIAKLYLNYFVWKYNYQLVHIANFDAYFCSLYESLSKRVPLTMNIADCRFHPEFENHRYDSIKKFIKGGFLSGIYSWYMNTDQSIQVLNKDLYFKAANYCFTDTNIFQPEPIKKKSIVFASRLSIFKRPDHFILAVKYCLEKYSNDFKGWEFHLLGTGEMDNEVKNLIETNQLSSRISTGFSFYLNETLNHSSIFVSTQMYENFTSLSMLEAMASGNAIVAYNLGQTNYFLQDRLNGILVKNEDPIELADALHQLAVNPEFLNQCRSNSVKLVLDVHNVKNFASELESFWKHALKSKA
jgi:glycosyltransferase involved in cell wall biosynthesis